MSSRPEGGVSIADRTDELERATSRLFELLPTIDDELDRRASRLEDFHLKGGTLCFCLERHPHLFGMPTMGRASGGYFIVEQRYAFDLVTESVRLIKEAYTDIEADAMDLVDEDLDRTFEGMGYDKYLRLKTEDQVRSTAEDDAEGMLPMTMETTFDLIEAPENPEIRAKLTELRAEFEKGWVPAFVDRVVDYWKRNRDQDDADE